MKSKRDSATVTSGGDRIETFIDGVSVRLAVTQTDKRGELCEIYNPAWGFSDGPVAYAYMASIRPGRLKGWVVHKEQTDRLFVQTGFLLIVLYDTRDGSPTYGMVNEIDLSERRRGLVKIPPGVAHAVINVGATDGYFVNLPDRPYNHANPDKYRIPKESIPYALDDFIGW